MLTAWRQIPWWGLAVSEEQHRGFSAIFGHFSPILTCFEGQFHREEIVLSHLRIGHTRLTHFYLTNGDVVPRCVACNCNLAVKHFLIECGDFAEVRQRYYDAENLQQLLQEICITHMYLTFWVR